MGAMTRRATCMSGVRVGSRRARARRARARARPVAPCLRPAGFAVVAEESFGASADEPLRLQVTGESRPGRPFQGRLDRGQAVRIMTGAPVPPGADAVLPAEVTREDGARVQVLKTKIIFHLPLSFPLKPILTRCTLILNALPEVRPG